MPHAPGSDGWLDEVYLFFANLDELQLKACPLAPILPRLDLHHVYWHEPGDYDEAVLPEDHVPPGQDFTALYVLTDAPFLRTWSLIGQEADFEDGHYNNEAYGEGLVEILEKTPRLEELQALAHNVDMERLFALGTLPATRLLLVYHGVEEYPLDVLAANPGFPSLERLRLHPANGGSDQASFLPREQVAALCRTPHLPALKHLHVHGSASATPAAWTSSRAASCGGWTRSTCTSGASPTPGRGRWPPARTSAG